MISRSEWCNPFRLSCIKREIMTIQKTLFNFLLIPSKTTCIKVIKLYNYNRVQPRNMIYQIFVSILNKNHEIDSFNVLKNRVRFFVMFSMYFCRFSILFLKLNYGYDYVHLINLDMQIMMIFFRKT